MFMYATSTIESFLFDSLFTPSFSYCLQLCSVVEPTDPALVALDELARRDPHGPAHRFNEALVKVPPAELPGCSSIEKKMTASGLSNSFDAHLQQSEGHFVVLL